jgi:hypothetical protein
MGKPGPVGDIEGHFGMRSSGSVAVMIAELLDDFGERSLLIGGAGTLPIKTKALIADRAVNVSRGTFRGMTQDLHRDSY